LRTAEIAARRFNPEARVRLVPDGAGVRFELTDGSAPGDTVVHHDAGFTLFVAPGLVGMIDVVDPHDQLVLVPHEVPPSGIAR